ncbi:MAG: murein biosynthesis integral membrane protein MurJ [Burkholderiales bacterium]
MNLLKALAQVSSMTLLSRILGFVRDTVIARAFGAGMETDAFFVAFRIPNLLRRLFAEGAFSQAFVPVLSQYKNQQGFDATKNLVDHVASALALALFVVTLIGIIAAPWIIYVSAPGFSANPNKFQLTVDLLRITFPYIFFISLVAFAGGILNTYSKFSVPAFTPVLLNLSFIFFALVVAPHLNAPVTALAWGALFGGVLQLAFQLPHLTKLKLVPRWRLNFRDSGVWRILRLMGPAVFGVSIGQISLLISTIFASFLVTGSVSWLFYADRLMEFPTGLLGVGLGTILLPSLAKHFQTKNFAEYSKLLDWGLRLTFLFALPAALALALLAVPLVTTLFHYGQFSDHDVWMTRNAVMAYSVGLTGLILVKILAPGFYARQNIRTPVKIGLMTLAVTQALNLMLLMPLQHVGLALATGLGACFNAAFLFYKLRQYDMYRPQAGWLAFVGKLLCALTAMGLVLWGMVGDPQSWFTAPAAVKVGRLSLLVALGIGSYFAILVLLGFRPRHFSRSGAG